MLYTVCFVCFVFVSNHLISKAWTHVECIWHWNLVQTLWQWQMGQLCTQDRDNQVFHFSTHFIEIFRLKHIMRIHPIWVIVEFDVPIRSYFCWIRWKLLIKFINFVFFSCNGIKMFSSPIWQCLATTKLTLGKIKVVSLRKWNLIMIG